MSMPNLYNFVVALRDYLLAQSGLAGHVIEAMAVPNSDANRAAGGWIGIYMGRQAWVPRTLGRNSGGMNFLEGPVEVVIAVQRFAQISPLECAHLLATSEGIVVDAINAVANWQSLGVTGFLASVAKEYLYDEAGSRPQGHLQTVRITLAFQLEN